jgi:hypothetical protein
MVAIDFEYSLQREFGLGGGGWDAAVHDADGGGADDQGAAGDCIGNRSQ